MSLHAFNSVTFAPSEYDGLDFIQIFTYNDKYYGVLATGIYEMSGADDAGTDIDCYIETGKMFNQIDEFRCIRAYVRCQAADDLLLTAKVDVLDAAEMSSEVSYEYTLPGKSGTKMQNRTVRLRADVEGNGWTLQLGNVAGGAFDIVDFLLDAESIEIEV